MHLSNSFFLQKNKVPMKKKKFNNISIQSSIMQPDNLTIYQFKVPLSANYLTISMVVGGSFLFLYLCSFQQHKNYTTYSWPKEKSSQKRETVNLTYQLLRDVSRGKETQDEFTRTTGPLPDRMRPETTMPSDGSTKIIPTRI